MVNKSFNYLHCLSLKTLRVIKNKISSGKKENLKTANTEYIEVL